MVFILGASVGAGRKLFLPAPFEEGGEGMSLTNPIVLGSPDVAAGAVLLSCQSACFTRGEGSITPGALPVGFDFALFSLKESIFSRTNFSALNSLVDPLLLSSYPPGERSGHCNGNRSENKCSDQNS